MRWDQHRWYDRIVEPLEGHSVAVTVVFSLLKRFGASEGAPRPADGPLRAHL